MKAHTIINGLRILAGILIIAAIFLPLYTVPASWSGGTQAKHVWDLVRDDTGSSGLLALAFLGPLVVVGVYGIRLSRTWSTILLVTQLALLGMSAIILVAVAHSAFTSLHVFGPWFIVPVSGSTGTGIWLGLTAVGVLLLLWLISVGRQLRAQT